MRRANLELQWRPDCQGKADLDGPLVHVSSRSWPRGGSSSILNTATGEWSERDDPKRQHIKPSAVSSIYVGDVLLVEKEFEAETEERLHIDVRAWVMVEFTRISHVLQAVYRKNLFDEISS